MTALMTARPAPLSLDDAFARRDPNAVRAALWGHAAAGALPHITADTLRRTASGLLPCVHYDLTGALLRMARLEAIVVEDGLRVGALLDALMIAALQAPAGTPEATWSLILQDALGGNLECAEGNPMHVWLRLPDDTVVDISCRTRRATGDTPSRAQLLADTRVRAVYDTQRAACARLLGVPLT